MRCLAALGLAALCVPSAYAHQDWRIEGGQAGTHLGHALSAGDFNGDGFGDLLVSAPEHDGAFADEGRVTQYLGSSGGLALAPSWTMSGRQSGAHFGAVMALAGDVNADGFDDALIGAPDFDTPSPRAGRNPGEAPSAHGVDHGRVWLVLGSPTGFSSPPQRVLCGLEQQGHLGASLACAGDVNGDGFDDVLVGATGAAGGRGRIEVFAGSAGGLLAAPLWKRVGAPDAGWGRIVAATGDVNADGFDDILCSANQFGGFCGNQDVFLGTAAGPMNAPIVTISQGVKAFGATRDFDLDGRPESVFVAKCSSTYPLVVRDYTASSVTGIPIYDAAAVTAGDFNGDGRPDIVAGVPTFQYESFFGRVSVLTNLEPYPPISAFPLYDGDQPFAGWGEALAAIDVDGDGADELIVGAPRHDAGELDEGIVVLFPGRNHEFALAETEDSPRTIGLVADFNGDGFSDTVSSSGGSVANAEVRYGTSLGLPVSADVTLVIPPAPQPREFRSLSFSAGDDDGDGDDDLYLRSYTFDTAHGGEFGETVHGLYRGSPAGLPLTHDATPTSAPGFIGDVTGDGFEDALAGNVLLLGSSSGLFPAQTLPTDGGYQRFTGNLDGDGYLDLLLVLFTTQGLAIYHGSPAGLVLDQIWWGFPAGTTQRIVALLDADGDGLDDLLSSELPNSKCRVFARTPAGFERAPQWFESPVPPCCSVSYQNPQVLAALDANADGFEDLLLVHQGQCSLHTGSPSGISRAAAWAGSLDFPGVPPLASYQTADFDGDGDVEVIVTSYPFPARIHEVEQP